ncbi:carboxypeptidase-like regulatory domain-containing protein [Porphyromonas gingivicanis]|nr:carboxypeptidase-like regulatory domain-containing protein [Porphyromonas gingivicanis]
MPAGQRTIVAKFVGYSTCEEKVHIENGTLAT